MRLEKDAVLSEESYLCPNPKDPSTQYLGLGIWVIIMIGTVLGSTKLLGTWALRTNAGIQGTYEL